jgi:hypothetical protein
VTSVPSVPARAISTPSPAYQNMSSFFGKAAITSSPPITAAPVDEASRNGPNRTSPPWPRGRVRSAPRAPSHPVWRSAVDGGEPITRRAAPVV